MSLYNQILKRDNSITKSASDESVDTDKMKVIAEEMKLIAKKAEDEKNLEKEVEVKEVKEAEEEKEEKKDKKKEEKEEKKDKKKDKKKEEKEEEEKEKKEEKEAADEDEAEEVDEEEVPEEVVEEVVEEEVPEEVVEEVVEEEVPEVSSYEQLMALLQDPENQPETEEEMQAYNQLMQLLEAQEGQQEEYPDEIAEAISEMVADGELTEEEAIAAYQLIAEQASQAPIENQASATDIMLGLLKEAEEERESEEMEKKAAEEFYGNIEKAAFDFLDDFLPKAGVTPEKYAAVLLEEEGETAEKIGKGAEKLESEEGLSVYKVVEDIINKME